MIASPHAAKWISPVLKVPRPEKILYIFHQGVYFVLQGREFQEMKGRLQGNLSKLSRIGPS
jgi:hypothetical protein